MQNTPKDPADWDMLDATTVASFKCGQCGNMYPISQKTCDVCGHDCSVDVCQIVHVSNQDY